MSHRQRYSIYNINSSWQKLGVSGPKKDTDSGIHRLISPALKHQQATRKRRQHPSLMRLRGIQVPSQLVLHVDCLVEMTGSFGERLPVERVSVARQGMGKVSSSVSTLPSILAHRSSVGHLLCHVLDRHCQAALA